LSQGRFLLTRSVAIKRSGAGAQPLITCLVLLFYLCDAATVANSSKLLKLIFVVLLLIKFLNVAYSV